MSMGASNLATQLLNVDPESAEVDAIENIAEAYRKYTLDAECNGELMSNGPAASGKTAMKTALAGISASGQAKAKLQAGINAFWTAAIPLAWPTWVAYTVQPGTMANLQTTFDSNTSGNKSKADATAAIATDMHAASSSAGGTVTFPGPIGPFPIT